MLGSLKYMAVLTVVAVLLAGCGLRGPVQMPKSEGQKAADTASAESGQGKPEGAAPKPHQGLIIDGLLR